MDALVSTSQHWDHRPVPAQLASDMMLRMVLVSSCAYAAFLPLFPKDFTMPGTFLIVTVGAAVEI